MGGRECAGAFFAAKAQGAERMRGGFADGGRGGGVVKFQLEEEDPVEIEETRFEGGNG